MVWDSNLLQLITFRQKKRRSKKSWSMKKCLYPSVIPQSSIKTKNTAPKRTPGQVFPLSNPCGGQVFHMHKCRDKKQTRMTLAPRFRASRSRNALLSSGEDFLKAPGRSSDKLQPGVMEGSRPAFGRAICDRLSEDQLLDQATLLRGVSRVSALYANSLRAVFGALRPDFWAADRLIGMGIGGGEQDWSPPNPKGSSRVGAWGYCLQISTFSPIKAQWGGPTELLKRVNYSQAKKKKKRSPQTSSSEMNRTRSFLGPLLEKVHFNL